MTNIEPYNGHIFIKPIKKKEFIAGKFQQFTKDDPDFRYIIGEVYAADASLPLKKGDLVRYDSKNCWNTVVDDITYKVIQMGGIISKEI